MEEVIYKEITPYTDNADWWKDITINSGASQRTLDDIKLPETAGCFTYRGNKKASEGTSNRFIYWRTFNDVMELVEVSLDVVLRGNCLRLHFERSPILQGVSIHEMADRVVILVATVSTIHKLNFTHPRKLQGTDSYRNRHDVLLPSIFYDASLSRIYDHSSFYVLNHTMSAKVPLPHTSCSWLMPSGEAAFVLANRIGSHLLVVMDERNGVKVTTTELKRTSVMSRLWNGLVGSSQGADVALSIVCHQGISDAYVFSLCRDLRIRMWSQNKQECLMIASVFEHHEENGNVVPLNYNAQQCYLKKSVDSTSSDYYLGVYISQSYQNQFFIFQPLYIADQYRLAHIATLYHEKYDLVDFCLSSSMVWSLWLNGVSEPVVKMAAFESNDDHTPFRVSWLSVELEPPVSRDIFLAFGEVHPKDAYVKEIFKQGRFSPSTISKAINIYRRIADSSFSATSPVSLDSLREEAVKAVEHEIFARLREAEFSEEEQQDLHTKCWDKFFSYCIQYHEVGTKPLGLAFDSVCGYAIIIKKNIYSLLCPCDSLEQLLLSNKNGLNSVACVTNPILKQDASLSYSVMAIFQCLSLLRQFITDEMTAGFEHDLYLLQSADDCAKELIAELELSSEDSERGLIAKIQSELKQASSLLPALRLLLKKIDLYSSDVFESEDDEMAPLTENSPFLSGLSGISVLYEGVTQFIGHRFEFCRDLLMLQLLAVKMGHGCGVSSDVSNDITEEVIPHTVQFVHAFYTLKWCTQCEFVPKQASFLESGLKQLSLIDIPDTSSPTKFKSENSLVKTIVYYFLMEQRINGAHYLFSSYSTDNGDVNSKSWKTLLPQVVTNVTRLMWPLGPHFLFPEFLLSQCQYIQLQGYVRLLEKWCEWNAYSIRFLSASCCLVTGEYDKALNLFIEVAEGVDKEEYVHNKIMQGVEDSSLSSIAEYYMKVIQLFEQCDASQCIITLASEVIGILDKNDSHIPIFWSLIFKHQLELGNNEEAYTALTRNPDPSRQKDCLRQLIVVLCERRQYQILIEFSYGDMLDEVVSILESRARSTDLLKQDFYDLLYTFHIHTNNLRKAASIMFEYGMRLGQEVNSLEGLQKQADCYLMTINCLYLVDPNYAWIVKPVPIVTHTNHEMFNGHPGLSPKRNYDGDEIDHYTTNRKVEVLEISDIRQCYDLIHARLLLVERDQSPSNMAATPLSVADCVALLVNAGLFDTAFSLCKSFSLPLLPIFEGLTFRCINMMQSKIQWLKENEMELFDWLSLNESAYPSSGYLSAHEQMWYLLKQYLKEYEVEGQTLLHRCIATKLLSFGVQMPAWLKLSYQKRNLPELLLLYINASMLENATDLAVDYIDSILQNDGTNYGVKYPLQATSQPIWMPHTYFDALLDALEDVHNEAYCSKLYEKLLDKLREYDIKVSSVSEIMLSNARNAMVF